jgi:hypothetical protein
MHRLVELLGADVQRYRDVRVTGDTCNASGSSPSRTIRCEMNVLRRSCVAAPAKLRLSMLSQLLVQDGDSGDGRRSTAAPAPFPPDLIRLQIVDRSRTAARRRAARGRRGPCHHRRHPPRSLSTAVTTPARPRLLRQRASTTALGSHQDRPANGELPRGVRRPNPGQATARRSPQALDPIHCIEKCSNSTRLVRQSVHESSKGQESGEKE